MLFSNTLQNPADPCVEADRRLMDIIANYLSKSICGYNTPASIAVKIFQKLNHVSAEFLAKRASQNRGTKRARRNSEPDISTSQSDDTDFVGEPVILMGLWLTPPAQIKQKVPVNAQSQQCRLSSVR